MLRVADRDLDAAAATASEAQKLSSKETVVALAIDIRDRESIRKALRQVIKTYGGLDIIVNTAAIFPSSPDGRITDSQWATTLGHQCDCESSVGVEEAAQALREQDLTASIVLTSFGERGCSQARERGVRHQQSSGESLDP